VKQSPVPRRKPLRAARPMKRGKGLEPGRPLERKAGMKRVAELPRAERKRKPARETGFPPRVRLAIRARAGTGDPEQAECELCAWWLGPDGGEIQHRAARGAGGCRDSVINGPANGALLCPPCHRDCEARDEHLGMDGAGFWIKHGTTPEFDPRNVPVMWHARAGSGVSLRLGEDGEYLYGLSGEEAAAA
jgi:hypothetical protein